MRIGLLVLGKADAQVVKIDLLNLCLVAFDVVMTGRMLSLKEADSDVGLLVTWSADSDSAD